MFRTNFKAQVKISRCLEDYSKNINFSVELAEMVVEAEIFPSVLTCLKVDNQ